MSESSKRNSILLIVMLAILGGMYAISTWSQNREWCVGRDENICKMLTHMKSHLTSASQGTYSENDSMNVLWSVHEDTYEFTYVVNQKEVTRVIGTEDTMYVRDYKDSRWWKQSTKLVEQYNVKLPFEPKPYTQRIVELLLDENTTYTATQATTCSARTCRQYHVSNKNAGLDMIINVDKEEDALVAFEVKKAGVTEMVTIGYDNSNLIEVPTNDIKIASSNQNIFLDMAYQLDSKEDTVPDYVDLFEQQRERAERSGEVDGLPRYVAPTSTIQQP